ncbi:GtrA family protein [Mesorhizobium hawassense]|uniref:GtrA family protein n=1 Tax=Mesorhizobium hawassense TaxID=1209954 RepID=A0A330HX45_9HYPH|nr:GtrA family protein [Mesorhizobium hawassense]RAZ91584.1 GtrA family protein [Mesorhizobium hawassense]
MKSEKAFAAEGMASVGHPFWSWAMGRSEPARVLRFAAIGGLSTLIYATGALILSDQHSFGMPAVIASVVAYCTAAVFSYWGHRLVTFMSDGAIGFEAARFACATAVGFLLSVGLATVLTDIAGLPPSVPVILACIMVPILNFIILRRFVFVGAAR